MIASIQRKSENSGMTNCGTFPQNLIHNERKDTMTSDQLSAENVLTY